MWVTSGTGWATGAAGRGGGRRRSSRRAAASRTWTTANVPPAAQVASATDAAMSFGGTATDAFDSSPVCRA